jgi:hypothetical protein
MLTRHGMCVKPINGNGQVTNGVRVSKLGFSL